MVSVKVDIIYLSDKTCSQSNNFHVLDANFTQISTAESVQLAQIYTHTDNMPCNAIQFSFKVELYNLKFLHIPPTFSFSVHMSCFKKTKHQIRAK